MTQTKTQPRSSSRDLSAEVENAAHGLQENAACMMGSCGQPNVGESERAVSLAAGSLLTVLGLLRGNLSGLVVAGLGAGLLYRGATGHCELYKALDIDTTQST